MDNIGKRTFTKNKSLADKIWNCIFKPMQDFVYRTNFEVNGERLLKYPNIKNKRIIDRQISVINEMRNVLKIEFNDDV